MKKKNKYTLPVYKINGKWCLALPTNHLLKFRNGDSVPVILKDNQLTVDFRKIIGRTINDYFKGKPYSEKDMQKKFGKYGW